MVAAAAATAADSTATTNNNNNVPSLASITKSIFQKDGQDAEASSQYQHVPRTDYDDDTPYDAQPANYTHRRNSSLDRSAVNTRRRRSSSLNDNHPLPSEPIPLNHKQRQYVKAAIGNLFFIALWYIFSTLISVYNKWMFSPDHYNFGYPLFVTTIHIVVQLVLCTITFSIFPSFRPRRKPSLYDYATKASPCGVANALDIGLSNLSLKAITITFYTMCKSSTLGFVLIFAFLFRLERPTVPLIGIIFLITTGVVLMVSAETKFDLVGAVQVLSASAMGGLRWSLIQILLQKEKLGMNNPIATLFWLAPTMGVTLAIASICIEGWGSIFSRTEFFGSFSKTLYTAAICIIPGVIAFMMNFAEFSLIQRTSVVTLSVAGIFKEVLTIFVGTILFKDELTAINISGLIIALLGIALYNYIRYRDFQTKEDSRGDIEIGDLDIDTIRENDEHRDPLIPRSSNQEDVQPHLGSSLNYTNTNHKQDPETLFDLGEEEDSDDDINNNNNINNDSKDKKSDESSPQAKGLNSV